MDKNLVSRLPSYKSLAIALLTTSAAAAANPPINLNNIKIFIDSTKAQLAVVMVKIIIPATNGFFLPKTSLKGPVITCPQARPISHAVSVN